MDMNTHIPTHQRETKRRTLAPIVLAVTLLGALLALAGALSSAIAQADATGATSHSAPGTLRWQEIPPVTTNILLDVHMLSSTDGWSVGTSGTVLHYNGIAWSPVSIPTTGRLVDVHMLNANDGFILDRENNTVYRWNGSQWSLFYQAGRNLNRVDALSADDVWVVSVGKIFHCNPCPPSGGTWTEPYVEPTNANIFNIEMFVGGQGIEGWAGGAATGDGNGALLLHYLNGSWTRYLPSPSSNVLYDSFFTSPTDGWAMGYTSTTYIVRYNGVQWSRAYTPTQYLDRMYMLSPNEGWMSGPFGDIVHFLNGNFIPDYTASTYLTSIAMTSNTDGWAVGDAGIMVHYTDDGTPSPTATGGPATATRTSTATPTRTTTAPPTTSTAQSTATSPPTSIASGTATTAATSTSTVIATAVATSTPCPISFSDVGIDNPFYAFIRCLSCRGIISGYSDGTFRPNNDISRGQIAKMVSNSAGFGEDPLTQIYEDVPPESPFYSWINRLSRRGHIGGYNCGIVPEEPCGLESRPYFRPAASATRGQLAKIVANAAGLGGAPSGIFYTDVQPDNPFYLWVMRLTTLNVMSGYPCGGPNEPCDSENRPYFRPYNNVTRGQASKIVANTFFPACLTPRTP